MRRELGRSEQCAPDEARSTVAGGLQRLSDWNRPRATTPSRFDPRAWRSTLRHNHPSGSIVSTLRERPDCSGDTRQWKHGNPLAVTRTSSLTVSEASSPQVIRRPYGHLRWVNAGAPSRQPGVGRTGLLMGGLLKPRALRTASLVRTSRITAVGKCGFWVERVVVFPHAGIHQPVHHFAAFVFVPAHAPVQHPLVAEHTVTAIIERQTDVRKWLF